MEEIKLDGRCCLSCQNFLVNRTFRNKEGEETIVTEADKGVCSEGAYQGEKVPVLFSCSHYQRWNTIDLELIKNRNQDITPYLYQDEEKEQEETIQNRCFCSFRCDPCRHPVPPSFSYGSSNLGRK